MRAQRITEAKSKCEWCQPWEEQGVELTHHTYSSCPLFKRNIDKKRHIQRRRVKMGEKSMAYEDPLKERRFILNRRQIAWDQGGDRLAGVEGTLFSAFQGCYMKEHLDFSVALEGRGRTTRCRCQYSRVSSSPGIPLSILQLKARLFDVLQNRTFIWITLKFHSNRGSIIAVNICIISLHHKINMVLWLDSSYKRN